MVAVVTSDDSSVYSLMLKVLPALAMGESHTAACSAPSTSGPLTPALCFLGNSVIVVPGRSSAPPALLLSQLFSVAGLPAGALNVLTGSDVTLAVKVAQDPSIRYVTYSGNKPVGVI